MKALILGIVAALVIARPAFRAVRTWCAVDPRRRPWLIAASVGGLLVVAVLVPKAGNLDPPWSESPAGIFVVLARVVALGALGVVALATLFAAAIPPDSPPSDPAA